MLNLFTCKNVSWLRLSILFKRSFVSIISRFLTKWEYFNHLWDLDYVCSRFRRQRRRHKCQRLWPIEWLSLLLLLYRTAKNANLEKHNTQIFSTVCLSWGLFVFIKLISQAIYGSVGFDFIQTGCVRACISSYCAERTSQCICNRVVALQHAHNILTTLAFQLYPCSEGELFPGYHL